MPEGPTIRNTADRLRAALVGRRVERFRSSFKKAAREEWADKVEGQGVAAVRSHGKNLFIDFANGWTLYSHMLMWGAWHIYQRGEPWLKEERKARVVIETAEQVVVLFSAPVCELIRSSELASHRTGELGPDLLAEEFDDEMAAEIRRRLYSQGETPVGAAIMDQTVMAGIGNILKSEILFKSGINPLRPVGSLSDEEQARLVEVSRDFMARSYETQGFQEVFLPPRLQQAVGKLGYVYGRSKQPCLVCGTPVQMVRQGELQRMTFFCPVCQPLDPSAPDLPAEQAGVQYPWSDTVRTVEEARDLVLERGVCGIFYDPRGKLPTLWDAVVRPGLDGSVTSWSEKMELVARWRYELIWRYPNEIVYTMVRGGRPVLMSMAALREHYPAQHRPVASCSPLAQELFAILEREALETLPLRRAAGLMARKDRSRFDRALQELQVTLNIVRCNRPGIERDLWVPLLAQYPELAATERHQGESAR